jgi:hypothetical protein
MLDTKCQATPNFRRNNHFYKEDCSIFSGDNRGRVVYIASEPAGVFGAKTQVGELQFIQAHQFNVRIVPCLQQLRSAVFGLLNRKIDPTKPQGASRC